MSQVLKTNCDYKIKTQPGGTITLDVGADNSGGQVVITADLVVQGETTTVNTTDLNVEDNVITLNKGETGDGVTLRYGGIEIDRGFSAPGVPNLLAVFRFDENDDSFEISKRDTVLNQSNYQSSALKVKTIKTDNFTDGGDLTLIGSGTGVVKVDGTVNYEQQVTSDDDIPNKRYVDVALLQRDPDNQIRRDDTYVIVQDIDGGARANALMRLGAVTLNNAGINYQPGDILILNEGSRTRDAVIEVVTVLGSGAIDTFTVNDPGLFSILPVSATNISTVTNSVSGTAATFDVDYSVGDLELVNPGDDYESVTINFIDQGGTVTPATATVTIDLDPFSPTFRQITSTTITDPGSYTDIPLVTFSAGINNSLTESIAQIVVENQIIATFFSNRAEIGGLEILGNTITNNDTNENIVLRTQGSASVEIPRGLQLNSTGEVILPREGATILYGDPEDDSSLQNTPGGTGVYFSTVKQSLSWEQNATNNQDPNINIGNLEQYPPKNELISKQRALAFSMLF